MTIRGPSIRSWGHFSWFAAAVFEALGGFDERFFVYFEDMDFAVRARKLGWSSVYLSTAQAFHRGQGTTDAATARRMFYFARSRVLYARKHFGAAGALAVALSTLCLEPLVRLVASPRSAGATLRAFGMLWKDLPEHRAGTKRGMKWVRFASPNHWYNLFEMLLLVTSIRLRGSSPCGALTGLFGEARPEC